MSQQPLPTLTAERRAAVANLVAQEGAVRVADLVARFDVHAATIRRDLKALEEEGAIERVHGGAIAVERLAEEEPVYAPPGTQEARIGQAAAKMIDDGETVFLGPGRLSLEVVHFLAEHSKLTVVTNGLEVAYRVATDTPHALIVTGGQVQGRDRGLAGQLARTSLSSLRADHVMLELDGVSATEGLTDDSLPQAEIARLLLEIGAEVIVLVPHERVGKEAAAYIAPVSDADVIVTAREAPSAFLWDLSEAGVRIVLA